MVVTQLDVLIVSQHQDDVGPDVPSVAVPLQPGAESVPGQVAGGVAAEGEEEKAAEEQEEEVMEAGGEPGRCHDYADLQSPPTTSASHKGRVSNSLASTWRKREETEAESHDVLASRILPQVFYWPLSWSQAGLGIFDPNQIKTQHCNNTIIKQKNPAAAVLCSLLL